MDVYKHYIKTKVVGSDTLVIDGYADCQTEKYDAADTQLSGTYPRQFQIQLTNQRGQCLYKIVNGQMVERAQTELDTELAARPPQPPSTDDKINLLTEANGNLKAENTQLNNQIIGLWEELIMRGVL